MSNLVFTFQQNINVSFEIKKAQEYNMLLKDCPINAFISAKDFKSAHKSIKDIFDHLKTLKSGGSYPLKRIFELFEAFSRDVSKRILKILEEYNLMTMENKQFEIIKEE